MLKPVLVLAACAALAACNSAGPGGTASGTPPASSYAGLPPGVSPEGFKLPDGKGCSADIARWKAIQDNDLNTGHVSQTVYDRIQGDIAKASEACQAGRDAEASSLVRQSRVRNGYPAG
jgi:hypothetical protein